MESSRTLTLARSLSRQENPNLVGVWPLAVVLLARQAVEEAVVRVLEVRAPGAERCANHTRLLCLREYIPDEIAERAGFLWATLSRACHHHPYELTPIGSEIDGWLDEADQITEQLRTQAR